MKIKTIITAVAGLAAGAAMTSCSEEGLMVNSNDTAYIVFNKDFTKDTTTVSFKMYNDGETPRIAIPVSVYGQVQSEDLHFHLTADESRTTLPAGLYAIPTDCVIKAGQLTDTVYVELSKSAEMQTSTYYLALQVVEEGKVRQGTKEYARAIISVTDRLFKPDWWSVNDVGSDDNPYNSVDLYYLGEYLEDKYQLFLNELKKDDVVFDGSNKQVLRKYAIKLKNTLKDINAERAAQGLGNLTDTKTGMVIEVPVAG